MSDAEVDDYLAAVPEPQRSTLERLRAVLAALLPDAEQGISYGVPCFKVGGKGVAGFASYKDHCTYLPMSGSITAELADELTTTSRRRARSSSRSTSHCRRARRAPGGCAASRDRPVHHLADGPGDSAAQSQPLRRASRAASVLLRVPVLPMASTGSCARCSPRGAAGRRCRRRRAVLGRGQHVALARRSAG